MINIVLCIIIIVIIIDSHHQGGQITNTILAIKITNLKIGTVKQYTIINNAGTVIK